MNTHYYPVFSLPCCSRPLWSGRPGQSLANIPGPVVGKLAAGFFCIPTMTRTAILYSRVSTTRQAEEGVSLDAQAAAMVAYCKTRGWTPSAPYREAGRSGRSREGRPQLERALDAVRASGGVLVVYSLSRLARSLKDACNILDELRDAGAGLAIIDMAVDTTTPMGEFVFNLFAAVAQFESQQTGMRVAAANSHIVAQRGYRTMGAQPIGWKIVDGVRVPAESELELVRYVKGLARTEKQLSRIAERLTAEGRPTISQMRGEKRGGPVWTYKMVRGLLKVKVPSRAHSS